MLYEIIVPISESCNNVYKNLDGFFSENVSVNTQFEYRIHDHTAMQIGPLFRWIGNS